MNSYRHKPETHLGSQGSTRSVRLNGPAVVTANGYHCSSLAFPFFCRPGCVLPDATRSTDSIATRLGRNPGPTTSSNTSSPAPPSTDSSDLQSTCANDKCPGHYSPTQHLTDSVYCHLASVLDVLRIAHQDSANLVCGLLSSQARNTSGIIRWYQICETKPARSGHGHRLSLRFLGIPILCQSGCVLPDATRSTDSIATRFG